MSDKPTSKIVHVSIDQDPSYYSFLALCEDGSLWIGRHQLVPGFETLWTCIHPAPVSNFEVRPFCP